MSSLAFYDPNHAGNHSRVLGYFNLRAPQPRYTFIWDVETVSNFLRNLPENDQLSNKLLALKKTILLARLLSASRVSENTNLNMAYLTKSSTAYTLSFLFF